jgi:hypothetical protein
VVRGLLQQPAWPVIDQVRIHVSAVQLADAAAEHSDGRGDVRQQQLAHALNAIKRERGRRCCATAAGETREDAAAISHRPAAGERRQGQVLGVGVVAVVCAVVVLARAAPACLRPFAHVPW